MKRILLIEDEQKLSASIKLELEANGYEVQAAFDGDMATRFYTTQNFDLVLLDINLPKINGFDLCKSFRFKNAQIPIIILTAFGDIDSKMNAFELGADDFLVKPFHLKELLAKVRVFLKRTEEAMVAEEVLEVDDLMIDVKDKRVTRAGEEIKLTAKEYALLEYLVRRNGRLASKNEIAEDVWDLNFDTGTNTIEVYISFLRNKIDKHHEVKLIHTKPGFGYYIKKLA